MLTDAIQGKVLQQVMQMAGLENADQQLPASVRVKLGTNRGGKAIHYFLNYSHDPLAFPYTYGTGEDLLAQSPVASSQTVTLKAWDLAIIEEK